MRPLGIVAALVVLALPGAAAAQSSEVKKYLNSAATLFENLEYEKALKQISRAKAKSGGAEDDTLIALYEGSVLSDMGKEDRAIAAFKTGLSLDPDAKLPLEVSPKVEAVFEKARASVKKTLAPQLAAQEAERKRREEEEKRRADEAARLKAAEAAKLAAGAGGNAQTSGGQSATGGSTPGVQTSSPSGGLRGYAWIPIAGGVALGATSAFFLVQAKTRYDSLVNGTVPPADATAARETGKQQQAIGYVLGGIGVAGLATGVGMFLAGGEKDTPRVSVSAGPGHAYVGLSGAF